MNTPDDSLLIPLPPQVLVVDQAAANPYSLRVALANGSAELIELEGARTLIDARRLARKMGYNPWYWTVPGATTARLLAYASPAP